MPSGRSLHAHHSRVQSYLTRPASRLPPGAMPKADSLNGWLKLMQQIRGLVYDDDECRSAGSELVSRLSERDQCAAFIAEKADLLSETMMMMRIAARTRLTGDERPIDEASTLRAGLLALPVERYPTLRQMRLIPALRGPVSATSFCSHYAARRSASSP